MAYFKESMIVKEADEQDMMRVQESTDPYAQDILNRIYDDANTLMVELEEMTMVFYNKYAKYLSKDTIKKYLKQINILKNELNLYEYKKDILSSRSR